MARLGGLGLVIHSTASQEPYNVKNKNSYKFNGLVNKKVWPPAVMELCGVKKWVCLSGSVRL